ncbi:MAG TPA: CoA transferase [Candidatus Binatia bacterium]|nr:CoA transferase [Candidatus Binatia bacterium]
MAFQLRYTVDGQDIMVVAIGLFVAPNKLLLELMRLGVRVILIEPISGAHQGRGLPDRDRGPLNRAGISIPWQILHRGMESIAVDFHHEAGRQLVLELIKKAHVLVSNWPTRMAPWLEYPHLVDHCGPQTIKIQIDGGYDGRAANDYSMQGATGLAHATGEPHGRPLTIPAAFFDIITGLHGLNAFHVGLRRLAETGRGDCYRIALEQVAFQTLAELGWYAQAETTGESREPIGDNLLDAVHGHYRTRDGTYVTLNLIGEGVWRRLREATGMLTLAYDTQGREIHGDHARYLVVEEIKSQIANWIAARSQVEVLKTLQGAGLVVEPCRDSVEAEQYARSLPCFHQVSDSDLGPIWVPGPVIEARDLEPVTLSGAPHPGEHTYKVLEDVLGLSPEHVTALERQGIVGGPDGRE